MAYVSSDAPLPPNSMDPPSTCEARYNASVVQSVENAAASGRAASAQVASPASFAPLGQGLVNDVTKSQAQLSASGSLVPLPDSGGSDLIPAPTILPLNVTTQEYSGCGMRGTGALKPIRISKHQQGVQMPPPAPTDTRLLIPGGGRMVATPRKRIGHMGMRGLGVAWGDALGVPVPGVSAAGPINWGMLALFGIGAVGLFAGLRKRGK